MTLKKYREKRNFKETPEPKAKIVRGKRKPLEFVIQKHAASHLHYDFRLEAEGVLKSWAIPKGPSLDPEIKRLAMMVEDHPIEYRHFEGIIPRGYGAGTVMIWDKGTYSVRGLPRKESEEFILEGLKKGKIHFTLEGEKLRGEFALVRIARGAGNQWLFFKIDDEEASKKDITKKDRSVVSGKSLMQIAKETR